jgi:hypothetical protein
MNESVIRSGQEASISTGAPLEEPGMMFPAMRTSKDL